MKLRLLNHQTARRFFTGLLFFFIVVPLAWGDEWTNHEIAANLANASDEQGSADNPLVISTAAELAYLAQQVNAGEELALGTGGPIENGTDDNSGFKGVYFALAADIDLLNHKWTPIGNKEHPFRGNFDGRGHCVSELTINSPLDSPIDYAGLFGYVGEGTIQNLGIYLDNDLIINVAYAGGIAGYNGGTIRNCYVAGKGTLELIGSTDSYVGGIAGKGNVISHCYTTIKVKAKKYAGGIVGECTTSVSYCYAVGDVEVPSSGDFAGGIVGKSESCSNNLAMNEYIDGKKADTGNTYTHRVCGSCTSPLVNNYASRYIKVNNFLIDVILGDKPDGSNQIDYIDFWEKLKGGWSSAWDLGDENTLPKLKMVEGYNASPTYTEEAYPNQPELKAINYLIAGSIANTKNVNFDNVGSLENPMVIKDAAELAYLARQVNAGEVLVIGVDGSTNPPIPNSGDKSGFKGIYFVLGQDINLSGRNWTPIGGRYDNESNSFRGNFDGDCHVINGLTVDIGDNPAGLFGDVDGGTIQNLGVEVHDKGIKGEATGENEMCAGAIAGTISGTTLRNCYVKDNGSGIVEATGVKNIFAGGIAGRISDKSSISNCYATVGVKSDGYAGGIAGKLSSSDLSYTFASGSVEISESGSGAGGICGEIAGEIDRKSSLLYNLALNWNVVGANDRINRIVGKVEANSTVDYNYASFDVRLNGKYLSFTDPGIHSLHGGHTWVDTWETNLTSYPEDETNEWKHAWTLSGGNLQLKKVTGNNSTPYDSWFQPQPEISAREKLPSPFTLHIVSPTGGTLTVAGNPSQILETTISDNCRLRSGLTLNLTNTPDNGYRFVSYLSGGSEENLQTHDEGTIDMPGTDLWLSASFEEYEEPAPPYIPPVLYMITLPAVEGVETSPVAGDYVMEAGDSFHFYLSLDSAYSESVPVVTTSRGETLTPSLSDGAYVVKDMYEDVLIFITGIQPNPATGNAVIEDAAPRIRTAGSTLQITVAQPTAACLMDMWGRVLRTISLPAGETRLEDLRPGNYIVKLTGHEGIKVIVGQ